MKFKRYFLIFFLCTTVASSSFAIESSNSLMEEKASDLENMYQNILPFIQELRDWESEDLNQEIEKFESHYMLVKRDYANFKSTASKEDSNKFENHYQEFRTIYEHIDYTREIIRAINQKKSDLETDYFKLWEEISSLKFKINENYLEKVGSTATTALGHNEKSTLIKKRVLYMRYTACYDYLVDQMRATREYKERIPIEERIVLLQETMLALIHERTRDLEKSLRVHKDLELSYDLIINSKNDSQSE